MYPCLMICTSHVSESFFPYHNTKNIYNPIFSYTVSLATVFVLKMQI